MAADPTYAYYVRFDNDFALGAASVAATASEDPAYPATNLIIENPAKPAKLTATSGSWVLNFSSAIAPVAAILVYQYLDAGLEVRIQGNSSNSWSSPPYNQTITIPAKRRDGPVDQRWTRNASLIITGNPSYAWWRLIVVGTNSQNVVVGRLILASALSPVKLLLREGIDEGDEEQNIVQPTELDVETVVSIAGPRRSFSGVASASDLSSSPLTQGSTFRDLHESQEGRQHPFAFYPFGQSEEPWLVRFESSAGARRHGDGHVQYWPFAVKEVSRGLPWP